MYNFVIRALCAALVLSLTACGGGGGGGGTPTPTPTPNTPPVITEGASTSVSMSKSGVPTPFSLSLHATDADNDTLTWSISSAATHGMASASGTGASIAVSYTPTANYIGNDSFAVQVADGNGGSASITVNVTVTNATPVIAEGASTNVSMSENGAPTAFNLTLHATDVNGDTLTWSISSVATSGTATASGTGASPIVSYTPNTDYIGKDSFGVQVSDGYGGTATITVNVTITTTNTVAISVEGGLGSNPNYNKPFVSVTICDSAVTPVCQTIDHILVDTGAVGLRILSSAFTTLPYTNLATYDDSNTPIGECYPLASGILWGTLRLATVQIAGEVTTKTIPIQVINDPAVAPSTCTGPNQGSINNLRANGILGVGYFKQDCGTACESASNVYYTCTDATDSTTCSAKGILTANQVLNPVAWFGPNGNGGSDNNGVIVSLPAIDSAGADNVTGTLIFGVNTQPNNQLTNETVLTIDNPTGYLPTVFDGQTLCNSLIDTGTNNLKFPVGTTGLPICTGQNTGFYCPSSLTPFTASIGGLNNGASAPVDFNVANTDNLGNYTAFNDIALNFNMIPQTIPGCTGSNQTAGSFVWGLPFFFGKDVFVVFEGEPVNSSTGPFVAF